MPLSETKNRRPAAFLPSTHQATDNTLTQVTLQGILGYSEGATTAATYLLLQARRHQEEGTPHRVKVSHA
jgi:hypothetical protein